MNQTRPDGLPRLSEQGDVLQWVRTSVVRKHADPFQGCWQDIDSPITLMEVDACLAAGREFLHPPFDWPFEAEVIAQRRQQHVEKVAWFVKHGFQRPLGVDVGCPVLNLRILHKVVDGNHRLAAAIYRMDRLGEDPLLPLSVAGEVNYAIELVLWTDDEERQARRESVAA